MTQKEAVIILREEIDRKLKLKHTNKKILMALKIATNELEYLTKHGNDNFWQGWHKHKKYTEKKII